MSTVADGGSRAATEAAWLAECQGRPPVQVWGTRGMVSSMHPAASQIGVEILRAGGNAVDAAVAVGAAMSVLSTDWAGPAGDSAWLVYLKATNQYLYLDGYSTCPAVITPERIAAHFGLAADKHRRDYEEEPPEARHVGMITGMVPGTPAAWCELASRYATLPLPALLEPAVDLAQRGFPVNQYLAAAVKANRAKLHRFAASRAVWFQTDGNEIGEGAVLKQPDLAETLRSIARGGHDAFYCGDIAQAIAKHSERNGGAMTTADLAAYRSVWREVLRGSYRGKDIIVTAPPTAGVHVLQALNILERYPIDRMPFHGVQALHLMIEALKLALADRRGAGGDPDFLAMDTQRLADKTYAAELRLRIDEQRATPRGAADYTASSTTHFAVADAMGNMVSATQTIGSRFGCGDTVEGTGMLMNDRTWWMSLGRGPNQVAPFHRANIGHAPTIIARGGTPFAALGSPGGFGIVQYLVQVVSHMVDHGLDIQRAIEAPRFKIEDLQGRVGFERRMSLQTLSALRDMGHAVIEYPEWTDAVGGVEGVELLEDSRSMLGGYDPRRNSMAVGA
jgi:gamma-glutamyltranspeptidase / glutathione hydrolase